MTSRRIRRNPTMWAVLATVLLAGPFLATPAQALYCPFMFDYDLDVAHEVQEGSCPGKPFGTIIAFTDEDHLGGLIQLCVQPEDGSRPPTCKEACGLVQFRNVGGYRATVQLLDFAPATLEGCPATSGVLYLQFG